MTSEPLKEKQNLVVIRFICALPLCRRRGAASSSQSSPLLVGKGHGTKDGHLRSVAPVLPYDVDLYNWESGTVPEPLAIKCVQKCEKETKNVGRGVKVCCVTVVFFV